MKIKPFVQNKSSHKNKDKLVETSQRSEHKLS